MKRLAIVLVFLVVLQACNFRDEATAIEEINSKNPIWIFAQFNVPSEKGGLDTYYYFGQVNESLYNKIASNRIKSGFILMRNVRYWNTNNTIEAYYDQVDGSDLLFRIEDIQRIRKSKAEPVIGHKYEDEPVKETAPPQN